MAIGLAVVVTVAGPAMHPWLLKTGAAGTSHTKLAAAAAS